MWLEVNSCSLMLPLNLLAKVVVQCVAKDACQRVTGAGVVVVVVAVMVVAANRIVDAFDVERNVDE